MTSAQLREKKPASTAHAHPVNIVHHDEATFGERVADGMAAGIGSWTFLIAQSVLIVFWIALNVFALIRHWDPYPFFLLNFGFTLQAAFTGPVLLLAGKRQGEKDRLMLEHAASESETEERRAIQIAAEIERNTAATLKILEHIKKRREESLKRGSGPSPIGD
jgi:uncharacterized membrane protein